VGVFKITGEAIGTIERRRHAATFEVVILDREDRLTLGFLVRFVHFSARWEVPAATIAIPFRPSNVRNPKAMNQLANAPLPRPPARWSVVLAFFLVYSCWGTTYLAIRKGVEVFPPALFGGSRIALAGLILLVYLAVRRQPLRMAWDDFVWTAVVGCLFFVGGNGLITFGEKYIASGVASILVATTPLWMALLETLWPWGERLRIRGWLGLLVGLSGVLLLMAPRLQHGENLLQDAGPLLVLGSSLAWSVGSFILRYRRVPGSHLTGAAYQMLVGGTGLLVIGLLWGEGQELDANEFTVQGVYAFFHLLVFGSLIGFVAYNWLLGHVPATLAGTYAYVNPLVAIVVGWFLNHEEITIWIAGGMAVILAGVALVRSGGAKSPTGVHSVRTATSAHGCPNGQSPSPRTPRPDCEVPS
jgi:drug/metabolite transporter (DMT)-like permease